MNQNSTIRYVKQSDFITAFAIWGAIDGFMTAKKKNGSTSEIILSVLVYSAIDALGAWALASVINEKK